MIDRQTNRQTERKSRREIDSKTKKQMDRWCIFSLSLLDHLLI